MEQITLKDDAKFRASALDCSGYIRLIPSKEAREVPAYLNFLARYLGDYTLIGLESRVVSDHDSRSVIVYGTDINEILIKLISESMLRHSKAEVMYP